MVNVSEGLGPGIGADRVVGILVLDKMGTPFLLTTYKTDGDHDNPCILRWDPHRGRWVNMSEERMTKDQAVALMAELGIESGECSITHHFVYKLIRGAWRIFEDVMYAGIRK